MSIDRGPSAFDADWYARHGLRPQGLSYTVKPTPEPEPEFTGIEMERLMAVKPTPYLDEADRIDPTWSIPEPKPEKPAGYGPGVTQWWRWMMGLPPE